MAAPRAEPGLHPRGHAAFIRQYLAAGGELDYDVEVVSVGRPSQVVYRSGPGAKEPVGRNADASVALFDLRHGPPRLPDAAGPEGRPGPMGNPGRGRWWMAVRYGGEPLESVIARARRRNLGISALIFVLLLGSVAALLRFTRQAQRLAGMQMSFVAGISHELRTALTVISTAAYNLRGRIGGNSAQVERYGALIQEQAGKLNEILEQVLQFAGAKAGRAARRREPFSVEAVIDLGLQSTEEMLQSAGCVVEKRVQPGRRGMSQWQPDSE